MKILQFGMSAEKTKGGIETYLINQIRCLPADVRYDFINSVDGSIAYEEEILRQGNVYNLGSRPKNPLRYYWRMLKLFWQIRNEGYSAFVSNCSDYSQDLPFLLAKIIGIKHRIMHAHGSGFENNISLLRRFMFAYNRLIVKFCVTDYWACSKKASKFLFGHEDAFIVHNGIDVSKYHYNDVVRKRVRSKYRLDEDAFVIGHVGRFSPVKNHLFLIDVFATVKRRCANAKLLLVGDNTNLDAYDGYLRKIQEKITLNHLDDDVIFTGNIENVEIMYQAMDLFLLPSISEGFPLVALEAQASGLSCIISTGVPREAALVEETTRCELNYVDEWVGKIISICHNRKKRMDNAEIIVSSGYSAKDETMRVITHLKELIAR